MWEYKVLDIKLKDKPENISQHLWVQEQLDIQGRNGWEAFQMHSYEATDSNKHYRFFMKRYVAE